MSQDTGNNYTGYHIERSLQPIIDSWELDLIQSEFARREGSGLHYSGGRGLLYVSSIVIAAAIIVLKSGIPTASIAAQSGNAMGRSKAKQNAKRHIYVRRPFAPELMLKWTACSERLRL